MTLMQQIDTLREIVSEEDGLLNRYRRTLYLFGPENPITKKMQNTLETVRDQIEELLRKHWETLR